MKISDEEFIDSWRRHGSAQAVANEFGYGVRTIFARRRRIETKIGRKLISEIETGARPTVLMPENKERAHMDLPNGTILVGSDCHYMPGEASIAHQGFCKVAEKFKPDMVMLNGDIFDFASISRHPRINTKPLPSLKEELEAGQLRCREIEQASPRSLFYRTLGNHDARLEVRIANNCPEFEGLITLKDFLPNWHDSVSLLVNGNLMFLHKWANGMHAAYNNALKNPSMVSVVTGHTHRLMCRPLSSTWTNQTKFGIETGTLADPMHDVFEYCLDSNKDWQSGFVMLTIKDGEVLYPEFAQVIEGQLHFRGCTY